MPETLDQLKTPPEGGGQLPVDRIGDDEGDNIFAGKPADKEATEDKEGAQVVKGQEGVEVAPQPKYTEAELEQRIVTTKGGYEGTIKKLQGDITVAKQAAEEAKKQYDDFTAQMEEQRLTAWLKSVEDGGGDVDYARQVADAQRTVTKQQRDLMAREREATRVATENAVALKFIVAHRLVKEHDLGEDSLEKLLEAEDASTMENKALTLKLEKVQAGQQPVTTVDSGVGSTKGRDLSKLSISERLSAVLEDEEERRK